MHERRAPAGAVPGDRRHALGSDRRALRIVTGPLCELLHADAFYDHDVEVDRWDEQARDRCTEVCVRSDRRLPQVGLRVRREDAGAEELVRADQDREQTGDEPEARDRSTDGRLRASAVCRLGPRVAEGPSIESPSHAAHG